MLDLTQYFSKKLNIKSSDIIVIGCSYGPDSMALLHQLITYRKKVPFKIVCAHVNHQIRKESKIEEEKLEEYCRINQVYFEMLRIEKYGDDNFHHSAREIRYNFFQEVVIKYQAEYLMTAHHGDDLMETILMRLVRGSSIKGYSGFNEIVECPNYKIIRPFIHYTKEELLAYDSYYNVPYAIDSSNEKRVYTRNRYRMELLPFLKEEDKNVHEKFLKFSLLLKECDHFIEKQSKKSLKKVFRNQCLDIKQYKELDEFLQKKIIFLMLEEIYQKDLNVIAMRHVNLLFELIYSKRANAKVYLPNHVIAIKSYHQLMIEKDENSPLESYDVQFFDYLKLPNGKNLKLMIECDSNGNDICRLNSKDVTLPLYVRTRKIGDKMALRNSGHKKLKDIFIDEKIPSRYRDNWPVVVDSKGEVLWLPGLKKSKKTRKINEECDIIIKYY